jgi:hypothetical protein
LSKRIYDAWTKSSPNGPKFKQKATEENNKWKIGFNAVVKKTQFSK